MRRARQGKDDGLSAVVGLVLVAALILSVVGTVQVYYMPAWQRDTEASNMRAIGGQFSVFRSEVDRLASDRDASPVASPFTLGWEEGTLLKTGTRGELSFTPGSQPVSIGSNKLKVTELNGEDTSGVNENWSPISSNTTVTNISKVLSFRLKITELDKITGPGGTWKAINVTLRDLNGTFLGDFNFTQCKADPSNEWCNASSNTYNLIIKVRDASGEALHDQGVAYGMSATIRPYWVDLMREDYRFDRVVNAIQGPFKISLKEQGLTGSYAITYSTETAGGTIVVGGGGLLHNNFTWTENSGTLRYKAQNDKFLDQVYVLEHGALILDQGSGAVFKVKPQMRASLAGQNTTITVGLPTLVGQSGSVAAKGTIAVRAFPIAHYSMLAGASNLTLNITTNYPSLWTGFWNETLANAGLKLALNEYGVAQGPDWARLSVFGTTPNPASEVLDLAVTFRQAAIEIDLG